MHFITKFTFLNGCEVYISSLLQVTKNKTTQEKKRLQKQRTHTHKNINE